jgi:hypothetical protein
VLNRRPDEIASEPFPDEKSSIMNACAEAAAPSMPKSKALFISPPNPNDRQYGWLYLIALAAIRRPLSENDRNPGNTYRFLAITSSHG